MRPQTEAILTAGTRVCAYWSERSRCLYPGYVHRGEQDAPITSVCTHGVDAVTATHAPCSNLGGPGEEEKEGSVMVEFDDGDRGRISLANIRLLPPGYQIHCEYLKIWMTKQIVQITGEQKEKEIFSHLTLFFQVQSPLQPFSHLVAVADKTPPRRRKTRLQRNKPMSFQQGGPKKKDQVRHP